VRDIGSTLIVFGILLGTERFVSLRLPWYLHMYLTFQTSLILTLLLLPPYLDFFAPLAFSLSAQALRGLLRSTGFRWIGTIVITVSSGLLITYGWFSDQCS